MTPVDVTLDRERNTRAYARKMSIPWARWWGWLCSSCSLPGTTPSMNCVDMQIPGQQWDPFVEKWVVLARTGLPTPSCLVTERYFPSHFVNWNEIQEQIVKIFLHPLSFDHWFSESKFSVSIYLNRDFEYFTSTNLFAREHTGRKKSRSSPWNYNYDEDLYSI